MKRMILLLVSIIFLASCGKKSDNPSSSPSISPSSNVQAGAISEYFPFKANASYSYTTLEGRPSDHTVYPLYVDDNTIQRRFVYGANTPTEVLRYKDGKLTLIFGDPQYTYFEKIPQEIYNTNNLILCEPLELGAKWDTNSSATSEITAVDKEIDTAYGKVVALEVTTSLKDGGVRKYYDGKGIGLVK